MYALLDSLCISSRFFTPVVDKPPEYDALSLAGGLPPPLSYEEVLIAKAMEERNLAAEDSFIGEHQIQLVQFVGYNV